jgi:hypothetical protein
MEHNINLHRKTRHYCMENFEFWMNKYLENRKGRPNTFEYTYEESDYDLFPRYNSLGAILQGVETLIPSNYDSFQTLKNELVTLGRTYESIFTKDSHGTEKKAIEDERHKFMEFVQSQTEQTVIEVPELFHRRRISKDETDEFTIQLKTNCDVEVGQFWWPIDLMNSKPESFMAIYEDDILESEEPELISLLQTFSNDLFYNLNEDGIDYELEKSCLNIFEISGEAFFFDQSHSWLIYYSHEDFYIFWGTELVEAVNNKFPNWKEKMTKLVENVP